MNDRVQEGKPGQGRDMHSLMKIADMAPGRHDDMVPEEVLRQPRGKSMVYLVNFHQNRVASVGD